MAKYTMDNTQGFDEKELEILNDELQKRIEKAGLSEENYDDLNEIQYISEGVLDESDEILKAE